MDDFNQCFPYEKVLHALENQLLKEKNIPSLLDQLNIQTNSVSISGLKDSDYPVLHESIGGNIRVSKTSAIPIELQERTRNMQQNCSIGVFSDVDRIWLSVDSDLFIWNYENGSDLAYYDGTSETILAVELVKPKPGIFSYNIHYLLVVAGQVEILILGVTMCGYKNNTLELVPEPLFRIATDNEHITIIQCINERIIMGTKSGNILEISYWSEKPSWFKFNQSTVYNNFKYAHEKNYKLCARLLNHSLWKFSSLLPNVIVNTLMPSEPILQIAVDPSRNIFYTRSERSLIAKYELLPNDCVQRLTYITEDSLVSKASRYVKSVEKDQFKNIIELCPLGNAYGPLNLMAVTHTGVRLYFMNNLQVCHIRMPPVNQAGICGKMSNVRLCCESRGSILLVCGSSIENQALYVISPDMFMLPELVETMSMTWTHGSSWFLISLNQNENKKNSARPVIQTQHLDSVRKFLMISVDSIVQLELPSPIHNLREILEKNSSPQCPPIKSWINHYGPEETVYAALVIASDNKNKFLSSRATELVLYYLNESIKSRFNNLQMSTYKYSDIMNPLHQVLCMYASRILRSLWDNCIGESYKPNEKDTHIVSTHDCEELAWFLHHLEHLNSFIRENYGRLKSIDLMKTPGYQSGPVSLALELLELMKITVEIISLWQILTEHQFNVIAKLLSPEMQSELLRCPVKQLLLPNKRMLLVALISALLQHYLMEGASTQALIDILLKRCPNIYRVEDALCSRANELLITVDNLINSRCGDQESIKQKKDDILIQAIELYEQVGPCIDLNSVIGRLRALGCIWGAVHLCLNAAKTRDPEQFAYNCLKEGHRPLNAEEINAVEGRNDAYKHLLESLSDQFEASKCSVQLKPSTSVKGDSQEVGSMFPNNIVRNNAASDLKIILNTIFDRKDDVMAHFEVYSWMIDNDLTDDILQFNTIHLELYLQHRLQTDPQSVPAKHLLWRHYELQGRLLEAAKVLDNLAVSECNNFGLDQRLECLSRAIVFVRAIIGGNQKYEIDYLKKLEDKVEICHLQKQILEEIGDQSGSAFVELNSRLFTIYQLLTDYAEPHDLTVSKLSILLVNGQNDVASIKIIWEEILEKEFEKLNDIDSVETRQVSLKQTVMQVANRFKDCGSFLPMDIIICHLEAYCDSNNFPPDWTVSCFTGIDIPIAKIIQAYFEILRTKNQEIKKNINRIYSSLCIAFDIFIHATMNIRDKQIYSNQFTDIIASCLIQLQSKSDPQSLLLAEKFTSYKSLLEKFIC